MRCDSCTDNCIDDCKLSPEEIVKALQMATQHKTVNQMTPVSPADLEYQKEHPECVDYQFPVTEVNCVEHTKESKRLSYNDFVDNVLKDTFCSVIKSGECPSGARSLQFDGCDRTMPGGFCSVQVDNSCDGVGVGNDKTVRGVEIINDKLYVDAAPQKTIVSEYIQRGDFGGTLAGPYTPNSQGPIKRASLKETNNGQAFCYTNDTCYPVKFNVIQNSSVNLTSTGPFAVVVTLCVDTGDGLEPVEVRDYASDGATSDRIDFALYGSTQTVAAGETQCFDMEFKLEVLNGSVSWDSANYSMHLIGGNV